MNRSLKIAGNNDVNEIKKLKPWIDQLETRLASAWKRCLPKEIFRINSTVFKASLAFTYRCPRSTPFFSTEPTEVLNCHKCKSVIYRNLGVADTGKNGVDHAARCGDKHYRHNKFGYIMRAAVELHEYQMLLEICIMIFQLLILY